MNCNSLVYHLFFIILSFFLYCIHYKISSSSLVELEIKKRQKYIERVNTLTPEALKLVSGEIQKLTKEFIINLDMLIGSVPYVGILR